MAREVIKQETVAIWLLLCVVFGIPFMLIDAVVVWVLHDCWPMGYSSCFALVPGFEWHLAAVFVPAFLAGTFAAWRLRRKSSD